MKKDYYKILELAPGASDEEIKKAYKRLAKKYHPDLNPNNKAAEDKFKEVSHAADMLLNKKEETSQAGGGRPQSPQDFDEMFGDIFSKNNRRQASQEADTDFDDLFGNMFSRARSKKQTYIPVNISIDFLSWLKGGAVPIDLADGKKISIELPAKTARLENLIVEFEYKQYSLNIKVKAHPYYFLNEHNQVQINYPMSFKEFQEKSEVIVPTPTGMVHLKLNKENFHTDKKFLVNKKSFHQEDFWVKLKLYYSENSTEQTEFRKFFKI